MTTSEEREARTEKRDERSEQPDEQRDEKRDERTEQRHEKRGERSEKLDEKREKREERGEEAEEADEAAEQRQYILAQFTDRAFHLAEDVVYYFTGLLLLAGAVVVLGEAVWEFATSLSDGVLKAIEASLSSLLIVFILVELLSAVRTIITERELVAEPFLIVGILAAIKEMVNIATFHIEDQKTSEAMIEIGGLAGVVIGLCLAILILRRSRGETKKDRDEKLPA